MHDVVTNVFLVDSEPGYMHLLGNRLRTQVHVQLQEFTSGEDLFDYLEHDDLSINEVYIAVVGFQLASVFDNALNGLEVAETLQNAYPSIAVVMLANEEELELTAAAVNRGAKSVVVRGEGVELQLASLVLRVQAGQRIAIRTQQLEINAIFFVIFLVLLVCSFYWCNSIIKG